MFRVLWQVCPSTGAKCIIGSQDRKITHFELPHLCHGYMTLPFLIAVVNYLEHCSAVTGPKHHNLEECFCLAVWNNTAMECFHLIDLLSHYMMFALGFLNNIFTPFAYFIAQEPINYHLMCQLALYNEPKLACDILRAR